MRLVNGGRERGFRVLTAMGGLLAGSVLVVLMADLLLSGSGHLSLHFFSSFASRFPERAGIRAPLVGTFWLLALTGLIAVPVSVGAAIYLQEYAPPTRITRLIRVNVASLAGVPSIVYGILGLALFVRGLHLGRTLLAGALTLSLLIMPTMIMVTQEALRRVPRSVREGAYALGASRWQVVRHQVLPAALPGIVSGAILSLARVVGETAPLILVGAVTFIAFTPASLGDPFTALPVQIFNWLTRPQEEFQGLAAAAILVLLVLLLGLTAAARITRNLLERGR